MLQGAVLYVKQLDQMIAFYAGFAGQVVEAADGEYAVLQDGKTELVVLQIPDHIAAHIQIETPPAVRGNTPVKLTFHVVSIDQALADAQKLGGQAMPDAKRSAFRGQWMQDVIDPEGNVFQLREVVKT